MKHQRLTLAAAACAVVLAGCAGIGNDGWITLVDGSRGLDNFNRSGGQANWTATDGAIQATEGGATPSYLVTRSSYKDFLLRAEFWASDDANSGIFMRCKDAAKIDDESCYEANIFDQRPDPTYGTGAIVKVAPVPLPGPLAGGRWNTFEVSLRGDHLVVVMNGETTADVRDSKLASGPLALQWGRGTIKWRKVQVKPL